MLYGLPVYRKSMDSVDIVHRLCPAGVFGHCPWTLSGWSIGTRVHGQYPLSPWTMSTESMDIVHSVHGQCPLSPWTMFTETMDNVHWIHGQCPLSRLAFSLGFPYTLYSSLTKLNAYIQFTMHAIYISWHTMPICPSILIDILSLGPLPNRQIP